MQADAWGLRQFAPSDHGTLALLYVPYRMCVFIQVAVCPIQDVCIHAGGCIVCPIQDVCVFTQVAVCPIQDVCIHTGCMPHTGCVCVFTQVAV